MSRPMETSAILELGKTIINSNNNNNKKTAKTQQEEQGQVSRWRTVGRRWVLAYFCWGPHSVRSRRHLYYTVMCLQQVVLGLKVQFTEGFKPSYKTENPMKLFPCTHGRRRKWAHTVLSYRKSQIENEGLKIILGLGTSGYKYILY